MVHPIAEADERSPFGSLTPEEFYARHGVTHTTSSFVNPRGLRIFTQRWVPRGGGVLGAVAVVHGFTGESSWMVQLTAVHLAAAGFAVAALDHQGHGFSEGLPGHIPDIAPVLDDCDAAFAAFRADYPPPLPCFLYGESLGGAIALLLHLHGEWGIGASLRREVAVPFLSGRFGRGRVKTEAAPLTSHSAGEGGRQRNQRWLAPAQPKHAQPCLGVRPNSMWSWISLR